MTPHRSAPWAILNGVSAAGSSLSNQSGWEVQGRSGEVLAGVGEHERSEATVVVHEEARDRCEAVDAVLPCCGGNIKINAKDT